MPFLIEKNGTVNEFHGIAVYGDNHIVECQTPYSGRAVRVTAFACKNKPLKARWEYDIVEAEKCLEHDCAGAEFFRFEEFTVEDGKPTIIDK